MNIFLANSIKEQQLSQKFKQNSPKINKQDQQQNYCQKNSPEYQIEFDQLPQNPNCQALQTKWTLQEQKKLFQLHNEIGNKWAVISHELPGKTDNQIKNYLYSKLRKGLRRLNKIIYENFKKQVLQIKVIVIYKIIEATEQKFKASPFCNNQISDHCTQLKNRIIAYSDDMNELSNYQKYPSVGNQLISDLFNFSKQYKRKAKKMRKNSGQQQNFISSSKIQSIKNTNSEYDWSQANSAKQSDVSVINSIPSLLHSYNYLKSQQELPMRRRAKSKSQIIIEKEQIMNEQQDAISQKMQVENIEEILKGSGIFQDEFIPPLFEILKKPSQNSYRMDGSQQVDNYRYFEQSAIEMRIFPIKNEEEQFKPNSFFM